MKIADLKKTNLPDSPGVYFFRDEKSEILYIGKATSLQSRVRSYFAPDLLKTRGSKIVTMVSVAKSVTFEKTESVLEALMLEAHLIKKYKPYFNTKEKDDKSYNCVVITKEEFPRVLIVRTRNITEDIYDIEYGRSKDKRSLPKTIFRKEVKYLFGPFPNGNSLREAMKIIRKIFPFRDTCIPGQGTPCFNAQLGLCPGVCTSSISKKEYQHILGNLKNFFEGKRAQIIKSLEREMNAFAKKQMFEKAAQVRTTIFALNHIHDIALIKSDMFDEKVVDDELRIEGYDVAHISGTSRVGVMTVIRGNDAAKADYRKFKLVQKQNNDIAGLEELLRRRFSHPEWKFPTFIVVDGGIAQKNAAEQFILEQKLNIPVCAVLKNESHKPKDILGDKELVQKYKKEILLVNNEAHRFAIAYHTKLRSYGTRRSSQKRVS